jgi:ubiquinone/menaquinone biosynthesis C-methylase UbiE
MVFISMVWHHLRDKQAAGAEIRRVLGTGGYMCVRTSTAETLDSCLYLRFFPEARRISEATLPMRQSVIDWAMGHEFDLLRHVCVVQEPDPSPADYCARIQRRGLSDLASITDEQFQSGLAALRQYCDEIAEARPVQEAVDLIVFRC